MPSALALHLVIPDEAALRRPLLSFCPPPPKINNHRRLGLARRGSGRRDFRFKTHLIALFNGTLRWALRETLSPDDYRGAIESRRCPALQVFAESTRPSIILLWRTSQNARRCMVANRCGTKKIITPPKV